MEEIVHFLFVVPGQWQDRAGLLFGPFSPIYGCGAVLMTIFLNRFHKSNWLVIFLVAAVIGGAFEAFVSLFMQYAFGAVAWDYSNMPGSAVRRPHVPAVHGLLGAARRGMDKAAVAVHAAAREFHSVELALYAYHRGRLLHAGGRRHDPAGARLLYMRLSHDPIDTPIQQFYDHEFGDTYMADRFQSMTIGALGRGARVEGRQRNGRRAWRPPVRVQGAGREGALSE